MPKPRHDRKIDYMYQRGQRRQLANYLRTGSFRTVAGVSMFPRRIKLRRFIMALIAVIIVLTGLIWGVL